MSARDDAAFALTLMKGDEVVEMGEKGADSLLLNKEGRLTGMVSSCLPDISRNVDPEAFSSAHFLILSLIE